MAVETQMSRSMTFAAKTAESNLRQCHRTGKSSTWLPASPGGKKWNESLTEDVFGHGIRCTADSARRKICISFFCIASHASSEWDCEGAPSSPSALVPVPSLPGNSDSIAC